MKNILLIIVIILFSKCGPDAQQRRAEIKELKLEKKALLVNMNMLNESVEKLQIRSNNLKTEIRESKIIKTGKADYFVEFEWRQIRKGFDSFDITKNLKDEMNKFSFSLPVSQKFYDSCREGETIVEMDRKGSIITEGTFSTMTITIIDKWIEKAN